MWPKRGYIASGGVKLTRAFVTFEGLLKYAASLVHDEAGTAGAVGRLRSWIHPIRARMRRTLSSCLCGSSRRYAMVVGCS